MVRNLINRYSKGQLEGVTLPDWWSWHRRARFYLGTIFEATVYRIVGEDKYLKWPWLASFFERWH